MQMYSGMLSKSIKYLCFYVRSCMLVHDRHSNIIIIIIIKQENDYSDVRQL